MLPRIAMPSAPPSSALVAEIPAAAPAGSGGAAVMIMSLARVKAGADPREKSSDPTATDQRPADTPARERIAKPAAPTRRPTAMTLGADVRRGGGGASNGPHP